MSQLLAPYNNSMRLGQGFNSYTQQICLDKAVLPDPNYDYGASRAKKPIVVSGPTPDSSSTQLSAATSDAYDETHDEANASSPNSETITVQPWVKPQIVTYSSRFVDKLSDVTGMLPFLRLSLC